VLPVFTAEEMRRLDQRAISELGIPGRTLMENAGRAAADVVLDALRERRRGPRGARVVVVCGKGGNAGDGFVAARRLRAHDVRVRVLLLNAPAEIGGDAAVKYRELRRSGIRPEIVGDAAAATAALARADLVVDAMLGTGARGSPTPPIARMIERINASGRPVVALDVPSGLSADGDPPPGPVVRATLTVTFAGLKRGLLLGEGAALAGRVRVAPIGIPPAEVSREARLFALERGDVAAHFPARKREAHKGDYGHLLVVAGSVGKTGAAALAAAAALRSGVGLVTVATAASQQPVVAGLVLEAMTEPLPETPAQTVALAAQGAIATLAAARDAVALGPGIGLDDDTRELARVLARDLRQPLALDADALSALAGRLELLRDAPGPRCLTPHPGEMARMLGVSVAQVQRDRIATAREFAVTYKTHVVLKGAASVIGDPDGRILINPTGNPGMASGGTGDVLTGILGAFLARGLGPAAALPAAVYLHGLAGDLAAERVGEEGLIASDVVAAIPAAFEALARAE
jgi:NAD(P)H-hydrate epimerase